MKIDAAVYSEIVTTHKNTDVIPQQTTTRKNYLKIHCIYMNK
jgi:hypothetical protein